MALARELVVFVWSIGDKFGTIPTRSVWWTFIYLMGDNVVSQALAGSWLLWTDNTVRIHN